LPVGVKPSWVDSSFFMPIQVDSLKCCNVRQMIIPALLMYLF
jgi:hypothetical protein